jgi:hypothetical protein
MHDIISTHIVDLEVQDRNIRADQHDVTNFRQLYYDLRELMSFNYLSAEKARLENSIFFNDKSKRVILNNQELNEFKDIINSITFKSNAVLAAIAEALPEQEQNSISIKLPSYTDLSKISLFIKDINNILGQTLVGKYQSSVTLQNFDTGSNWIEIIMSNPDALVYFGYVYKAATELVRVEFLKYKQIQHGLKNLKVAEEAKEQVLKGLENELKTKAELNAKIISGEAEITENIQEYQAHLTKSILKLSEYIYEGAEVHTALNAPQETQNIYPDVQETMTIVENAIGLLTDGSDISNEHDANSEEN